MENTKYAMEGEGKGDGHQYKIMRAKAQDTRANPNGWVTHLVMKIWDIGHLRALSPRFMTMIMMMIRHWQKLQYDNVYLLSYFLSELLRAQLIR